jgi:hypothetical protein
MNGRTIMEDKKGYNRRQKGASVSLIPTERIWMGPSLKEPLKLSDITLERVKLAYSIVKKKPHVYVGTNSESCCPLEAIASAEGYFHWTHVLGDSSVIGENLKWEFIQGFDLGSGETEAAKLGRKIGEELGIVYETKD